MFLAWTPQSSHLFTRSLRLNGTSRDKVADIDALEQAFMVISRTQNCFDMAMVNEAKDSGGQGSGMRGIAMAMVAYCDILFTVEMVNVVLNIKRNCCV